MNIVSLDLEMNQLNDNPKIIEIGLTIGDLQTRKIIDSKSLLVNPNENITDYISKLTGITDHMVSDKQNIHGAYGEMLDYLKYYNVTHKQPVVWGAGDVHQLKREIGDVESFPFGFTEMNVKTIVQAILTARGQKSQGGLAKSMTKFGLRFKGTKHRAIDDSYNTMVFYFYLLGLLQKV